jgi:hypothetical protein
MNQYTQSIESIALESKFNKEHIPALLNVVNATTNPQTALQILLGIYEYPKIFTSANDSESEKERTFLSFEPITSKVTYLYYPVNSKDGWFKKGEENLSDETVISKKYWDDGVAKDLGITVEQVNQLYVRMSYNHVQEKLPHQKTVELSTWLKYEEYVKVNSFEHEDIF